MEAVNVVLKGLYEDADKPSAYGGVQKLYRAAKRLNPSITVKMVKQFLEGNRAYTLHYLTKKKFPRLRILAPKPKVILACDLCDMSWLAKYNKGTRYLLVCLDVFSRLAKVVPLKNKSGHSVTDAFKRVLESKDFKGVTRLFCDRGTEFTNAHLRKYLTPKGIRVYSTSSQEIKSSPAERFIRTLKSKIYRYLTANNTRTYLNVLHELVGAYNNTIHRGLTSGQTPRQVHLMKDPRSLRGQFRKIFKSARPTRNPPTSPLTSGRAVRIAGAERSSRFNRGYLAQNTEEIFIIDKVLRQQDLHTYRLRDLRGEPIRGVFYREELVPVSLPERFPVRVLRSRTRRGKREYFVRWVGYPESENSWITAKDLQML